MGEGRRVIDARNVGIYFLLLRLARARTIVVGRRVARFRAGWYVYVGSAQRGLRQRIARHLRRRKPKRWHIDYLRGSARVVAVRVLRGAGRRQEAVCARQWLASAAFVPMHKFGASDSPAASHLLGFTRRAAVERHPLWRRADGMTA